MSMFELGMSLEYAGAWGVPEAVREFLQNALDEQKENPENIMSVDYNPILEVLSISNKNSKLTPKTLLLGSSSKRGKSDLIGEHGEGYKVATVVLMRNGVSVNIYNNESKEVWQSRVVDSRRYGSKIVVFDISRSLFKHNDNLVIELVGITPEMWKEIVEKSLFLRDDVVEDEVIEGECGSILLNEAFSGKIYVEGLYVCSSERVEFGYNFKPDMISLDRDRGLVDTFDLRCAIAKLVISTGNAEFIRKNINTRDFQYIASFIHNYVGNVSELSNGVYEDFVGEYGEGSVPVSSNEEFNVKKNLGMNPVMVEDQVARVINIVERNYEVNDDTVDIDEAFENLLKSVRYLIPSDIYDQFRSLWSLARKGNRREN